MTQSEAELRHELEERLRFERLLAEISARFINLPTDQIDSVIEEAQRRVCECLGLDLSALWQWSAESPHFLTLTHLHSPPGGPERPERVDAQEAFPWQYQKMLRGETLAFSTEDLPPEADRDKESRRHYGIKSSVVIPLSAGGGPLIGVLTFDTLQEKRAWPAETMKRLGLVAQIFSNALIRKQSDAILHESEARLSLAAESSEAGLWELNCNTGLFWATKKALAIFGYDPGEVISMERFEASVHPDDLVLVRQAIARSLDRKEPLSVEYRILAADDSIKWISSSGRPYFKSNGEPDRLLGVSIDITNHKTIEERILASEARLATAIDVAALGFYEMNEDYRVSFFDDRLRAILGIASEKETQGREFWLAHIHPDDLPRILEVSRKVLEEGVDRFTVEYRYIHPNRGLTWLHHLSRVLGRNSAGRADRVIGVMQDITERKHAEEILQESEANLINNQKDLRRLANSLISAKEEELRRLSRELHDDLTQRLAVLAIEAGKLEQHMNTMEYALPKPFQKISQIKEQLIKVSEDVHRISRQLHPSILDDLGLVRAIESECAAVMQRENLDIIFRQAEIPERIPGDISLCLYRIIQEGLNNIISHSCVKKCEVFLEATAETLCLTVTDEGIGFDPVEVKNKPGLGLSSMRERVQLVRGNFSVESHPGKGTAVCVSIPLNMGDI